MAKVSLANSEPGDAANKTFSISPEVADATHSVAML
jgi:hypothetical protein